LRAHLARANDQIESLRAGGEALLIFQGPQAYISPTWYDTKKEDDKAVPTWNYVVVQVRGRPQLIEDPEWILEQMKTLTDAMEAGRPAPWKVSDAPEAYVQELIKHVVGLEIPIDHIEGKWKVSQNQPLRNQEGVESALRAAGQTAMADAVAAKKKL
jgi:transcriptional regulator